MKTKLLILYTICCSLILYYSCSSKGYEIEEIKIEIPDTQKTAEYDKHEPQREDPFEKNLKEEPEKRIPVKGPFTIQIGAFVMESNAQNLLNSIKNLAGYDVYYKLINGLYKVRVGNFPVKPDALIVLEKIKNAGFNDAFIIEK